MYAKALLNFYILLSHSYTMLCFYNLTKNTKMFSSFYFLLIHLFFPFQLQWLDSDIICLQEVDTPYFRDVLKEELSELGYEGLFAQKCLEIPEGVAVFFKQDKFHLEETKSFHLNDLAAWNFKQTPLPKVKEVLLLAALRHKISNNLLVVGKDFFKKVLFLWFSVDIASNQRILLRTNSGMLSNYNQKPMFIGSP